MPENNGFLILPGSGGDVLVYKDGIIFATFHGVKPSSDEPRNAAELLARICEREAELREAYRKWQQLSSGAAVYNLLSDILEM